MIGPQDPEEENIRRLVESKISAWNDRALEEFNGLSPCQVEGLLHDDWNEAGSAMSFHSGVPGEAFEGVELLKDIRLLASLIAAGNHRATQKGNLPRSIVKAMIKAGATEIIDTPYISSKSAPNEEDVRRIHLARLIADFVGMIHVRSGVWRVVKKREHLLQAEHACECFQRIMTALFFQFNLGYLDGLPEAPAVQFSAAFSLAELRHWTDWTEWTPDRARGLLLPIVRDDYPPAPADKPYAFDYAVGFAELRIIRVLRRLGLVELEQSKCVFRHLARVKTTPLFAKILQFNLERPMRIKTAPGQTVDVPLSKAQLTLIRKHTFFGEKLPLKAGAVPFTLDDLEDLLGHVAASANHAEDPKVGEQLSQLFGHIQRLLNQYE